jgi:hypothetical protein
MKDDCLNSAVVGQAIGREAKRFAVAAGCISLSGCIPWVDHYPRVEAPSAVYYRTACSVSNGPPAIAYYPFHGIFVSINVNGTVRLGLHVPKGYSVEVNDPTVRLIEFNGKAPIDSTYQIRAFRHAVYGDPIAFHTLPDPYTTPDNLGPLIGDGEGVGARFYLFLSIADSDSNRLAMLRGTQAPGSVRLPSLTINGQRYDPQTLSFIPKSYFGIAWVNC